MKTAQNIIVIGAGIVGVSTAIWLMRAGKTVTLIDRAAPGEGTSHGNGGVLASCAMVPVTTPGLGMKGPKLLLDRNFPLFLRWTYLPRLYPWLRKYMGHANDSDTRRIGKGLTTIVADSVEQHEALARGTVAEKWLELSDYTFAYTDRAAFEADAYVWELRKIAGFEPVIIEGDAVHEYEPALGPDFNFLAVMKGHGHIKDPGGYVKDLAREFEEMGGTILCAEVQDFELKDGVVRSVTTDQGQIECDAAVLTTGVWSKSLAKKLGLNVPLESERGYHIIFKNPSVQLKAPLMITTGKFVATPMADGLRCAGIVEFGGLEADASKAPLKFLRRAVAQAFPDLTYDDSVEWLGHRPAPADSLPLIGEIGQTGVYTGFGHHHIGLTGGPKTGRMIADMITQGGSNLDTAPFDPQRFSK